MTPAEFADKIRAYCNATGGSITSWGRTPARNDRVGGVADSAHLLWLAADVVYDVGPVGPSPVREAIARRLGLVLIHEDDHDHAQGG